ncbi:galanin receptor 2a [Pleuronectes platessa]|uniref:galanin receptor 2a n=1 Tax=Pleuronectes platessa TaxID=8262 RepID=UPI00232A14BF|nr:galanin receptor 2a [Pleuronectes platessa]
MNSSSWRTESLLVSSGFSLLFVLGTAGNSLVLAVLCGSGTMNTTNLFILNLGLADLGFIVLCVPFQATVYTLDQWLFGPVLCRLVHFFIFLTSHASIFTLAAVSVDRC